MDSALLPPLIQILTQAGFGGLCIWLIIDTRREARAREERMAEALNKANAELAEGNARSTAAMEAMAAATNRMADVMNSRPCGSGTSGLHVSVDAFEPAGKNR